MLGYEAASFDDSGLLPARKHWHYWLQTIPAVQKVAIASLLFLSPLALMVWSTSSAASTTLLATDSASRWHGVSLGGWLVMEINPSKRDADSPMDLRPFWMYDQIEANSELDFVAALRKEKGDEYAIATMKNHWSGYLTDEMLDAAQALGVDTAAVAGGKRPPCRSSDGARAAHLGGSKGPGRSHTPRGGASAAQKLAWPPEPAAVCAKAAARFCACLLRRRASLSASGSWTRRRAARARSSTGSAPRASSRAASTT